MHLVMVSPYPPAITGIGQYGYHASRLLASSGVFSRITVLCGQAGVQDGARSQQPSPLHILAGWQMDRPDVGWQITTRLRQLQPDVTWFNLGASVFGKSPLANLSGFLSVVQAHTGGSPTVVTLHELPELADLRALKAPGGMLAPFGARLIARLATCADVVCLTMRRYVDWLTVRRRGPHYLHIPTGAYYAPEILPEPAHPEILFFSTLAPFKGLETLLSAFRVLGDEIPGLRLTIAGTRHIRFPDYPGLLRAQFADLQGVHWLGQVAENEIRTLFSRASVVVLPYQASTGFSSVLMQAAAWGRAVVASDLEEICYAAHENGLEVAYFQCGQADSLADTLRAQLGSSQLRTSQAVRNFIAIQKNRPDTLCHDYLQAFNLALKTRRSSKAIAIPVYPSESWSDAA
jgi:glycosyltransferase involved in cell wall biosynthesis